MKITILPLFNTNEIYNEKLLNGSINYIKSKGLDLLEFDTLGQLWYDGESKTLEEVYSKLEKISNIGFLEVWRGYIHKLENGEMVKYKPTKKEINEGKLLADYIINNYN